MSKEGVERRLTTILAADVVGYSRLMAADESGTLARLKTHRKELIEPKAADFGGRVVKLIGDGTLMEFGSVVDAVNFAVDVQQSIMERNARVPKDRCITYRIGINIGDVIVDGEDIYGDGVNVAARLERLAEPGGVCISGTVFDHVKGKVELEFANQGEQRVKNLPEPLHVYSVVLSAGETETEVVVSQSNHEEWQEISPIGSETDGVVTDIDLSLPDSPSIAVLPFTNMSGDDEQTFFSDGITEDIITALSKVPSLLVVARNSTFTYKGRAVDVKQVSSEQGVRYVLEGSVRKAGTRVRVTAQLIDATTGHHLWAERYDRDLDDIFDVQDDITREVVVALDVHLREGEQARIWSGGTKSVEAWECVRLGMEALNRVTPESRIEANRLIRRAIDFDPNYPMAWVALGWHYFHDVEAGAEYKHEAHHEAALNSAIECAAKALELDKSCADAYGMWGLCLLSNEEYDEAIEMSEKAVALAPNHAENLATTAMALCKAGQPERSYRLIKRAMRLCPIYPAWYLYVLGLSCRLLGLNESAVEAFESAIKRNPSMLTPYVGLASSLGELGRNEDAKKTVSEILTLDPGFSIRRYIGRLSYRNAEELSRFEDGLRKSGLPE